MKSTKWVDALNPDCDLFFSISQRHLEIRSSYDSHLNELLSWILLLIFVSLPYSLSSWKYTLAYNVSAYLPIYFLYYIIVVFQVQLAQTALGIGHRFQRINIILRTILLNGTYGLLCYKTVTD